jgi:hypothetical protein
MHEQGFCVGSSSDYRVVCLEVVFLVIVNSSAQSLLVTRDIH